MAYVPPHKRVSDANKFKPSPATPPSSSRIQIHPKNLPRDFRPDVIIRKSTEFIGRFIVACDDSIHGQSLEFVKFDGESFAHLQNVALYRLQLAGGDLSTNSSDVNDDIISGLSLKELRSPVDDIIERLRADLEQMFEKVKTKSQVDRTVPAMWFKFGRLLFKNESRTVFDWCKECTSYNIEQHFQKSHFFKVFDNALTEQEYLRLYEFANRTATQTWSKDEYFIQVSDMSMPNMEVWCICEASSNYDERDILSGRQCQTGLQIKKVRKSPVRHMVCDVACIGKTNDIRLMFYFKEYLHGLTQDELLDLRSCFSNARIDDNAKGGLNWTFGTGSSTSGRFKIVSSFHEISTFVIGGELKWRFQKCNRGEFKASSGRVTCEVTVKPVSYKEFRKGTRDWSTDEFMFSLVKTLQQMWIQCA